MKFSRCSSASTSRPAPLCSNTRSGSSNRWPQRFPDNQVRAIDGRIIPGEKWMSSSEIAAANQVYGIEASKQAVIKVIGVGGGGSNVVNRMMEDSLAGVEAWVINTDAQALANSSVDPRFRIQIGEKSTRGLGAGGNPDVGLEAAKESREAIEEAIRGADMVFVTAGLGGGTGSGAAPEVCRIAKQMKILTIAFATMPFTFEGRQRRAQAAESAARIAEATDTMVVVPNDRLLDQRIGGDLPLRDAFKLADSALVQGVRGISDIILVPGMVNVDFADVKSVMYRAGNSHMAHGRGAGKGRAVAAAQMAIESPLLETGIHSASGVVWNITGPPDLCLSEVNAAAELIYAVVDEDANIIFGAVVDPEMREEVNITLIATGFKKPATAPAAPARAAVDIAAGHNAAASARPQSAVKIPSFLQKRNRR